MHMMPAVSSASTSTTSPIHVVSVGKSNVCIVLQLLALTVQLHVLFASSSRIHPVVTDDAGPVENG